MGRYLCQLCYSIVNYGERHPCFFYKNDGEVYRVPTPKKSDETGRKSQGSKRVRTGVLNNDNGRTCVANGQNYAERFDATNSWPIENNEQISVVPASRRKRSLPPKCFRGVKKRDLDLKSASPTCIERHGAEALKPEDGRKVKNESAAVPDFDDISSSEMSASNAALVAATREESVAGPSGIQDLSRRTGKEKRFRCDVCGKQFGHKRNLKVHEITHTGEKRFCCDFCGKEFGYRHVLKDHERSHTGEKPYKCKFCSKRFSYKTSINCHLRTHIGEKPYKCKFCDKEFAVPSTYRKHLKGKHGQERS